MDAPDFRPGPFPVGEGAYGDPFVRLARLRKEFAGTYPGLDAGAWYPAASLAEYFKSWLARRPDRGRSDAPRGLETAHFEFRGGVPRDPPWLPGRSPDERHLAPEP